MESYYQKETQCIISVDRQDDLQKNSPPRIFFGSYFQRDIQEKNKLLS